MVILTAAASCSTVRLPTEEKDAPVHTPSLQEVIENGSILINTPGEMASCIGCRFRDHCPSTIEILCCIHAGTEVGRRSGLHLLY